ncbi:MAG: lipid-A-disaccharide synthase [Candidatus Omnitrophica bacterium]|nr:lipid-A-disaccharide synthase [Candidatus Omnitrophota bacterium]
MPKKIFLVACETSGDAHGAYLLRELAKINGSFQFRGLGGLRMKEAGLELLKDMTKISALGLGDVLRLYFTYRKIFYQTVEDIKAWKPDAVVVIDSPAFNLRLAKKISGFAPVLYYISPQLWAWGGRRIHIIKRHIARMLVILPFEVPFYEKAGVESRFVGHPLLDELDLSGSKETLRAHYEIKKDECAVGLLPGSREKEVRRIFPIMLKSATLLGRRIPQAVFFLRESPNVAREVYDKILKGFEPLAVRRFGKSDHDLVRAMDFALVTSGTATLETALLETPFFLLYKAGWSTYFLGKQLIKIPYLGLVNLLAEKAVVPEFIQNDAKPTTIAHEAEILLKNPELCRAMKAEFAEIRRKLGGRGASRNAAEEIALFLSNPA